MRNYKEFEKVYIGSSDSASLILRGTYRGEQKVEVVNFGEDGIYKGRILTERCTFGSHYQFLGWFEHWLKVYDDSGLTLSLNSRLIRVWKCNKTMLFELLED